MNRNVESHFAQLPEVDISRSTFDRSCGHKTSFNCGQVIPFFIDPVLPGDSFKITTSVVARLQTLLTPVMDNIYIDTYYFYCPSRILWSHWKEFMGENTDSAWLPEVSYTLPRLYPPLTGEQASVGEPAVTVNIRHWLPHTIGDYMGMPVCDADDPRNHNNAVDALPFRAYAMCIDQYFRDQNLQDPLVIHLDDDWRTGSNGNNATQDVELGGAPWVAAKYHDYFTSCLPQAQKAEPFSIFDLASDPLAPVDTGKKRTVSADDFNPIVGYGIGYGENPAFTFGGAKPVPQSLTASSTTVYTYNIVKSSSPATTSGFQPTNLWADMSQAMFTINELRLAFQMQKYYEKASRGGTRYREILKEFFGITSPDARMQIPEYLGGHRFPLAIHQIANQSQGENDFLGDLGALSNTSDVHEDFVKSFTEHGYILGLMVARYDHSYSQGLERFWLQGKDKLDYYWPVFANIGEQPVYKAEIYAYQNLTTENINNHNKDVTGAFGFNEAWASYRYKPSRISGDMRPDIATSLASWHLGDDYDAMPTLSAGWIAEDHTNVDRVLAVTSSNANQIFADIYIKNFVTRPMPVYSVPGLADHH